MPNTNLPSRCLWAVLTSLSIAVLAGCGKGGPTIVKISGTVTRGGNPVADLTVNFIPETGRPSWGFTGPDGGYTLHYSRGRDGACVGKHKVWVVYDPPPADPAEEQARIEGRFDMPPDVRAIVEKYGKDSSPLEYDIQESQTIDLELD